MESPTQETINALLRQELQYIKNELNDLKAMLNEWKTNYVTQAEFWPIKMMVYGCATLILGSVITAMVYVVIQH